MHAQTPSAKGRRDNRILGVRFDFIDYDEVLATVRQWPLEAPSRCITITNPHSVLLCRSDEDMQKATCNAALTLPDGVGVILAARILGLRHQGRVTGPTLMLRLCDQGRAHGLRHFFYGGAEGVAKTLAERLTRQFPGLAVAGEYCPPFRAMTAEEDAQAVSRINEARPDIVWVGLGAPKQEKWMAQHADRVAARALIGVGAAFDFHSGRVRWAPAWIRYIGMEWAYRLAQEPRRMYGRNLNNLRFLAGVLGQRLFPSRRA